MAEQKFNVGDKVKILTKKKYDWSGNINIDPVGKVGYVEDYRNEVFWVWSEPNGKGEYYGGFAPEELELVTEFQSKEDLENAYEKLSEPYGQYYYGYTQSPTRPKTTMAKLSMLLKKSLDKDYKAMIKLGVMDESLTPTDLQFFVSVLLSTNKAFKEACGLEARKALKEQKDEE